MKKFIQILKAVSSAMIGVGSKKNLTRDFAEVDKSGPWPYILAGLFATIIFIFFLVAIVSSVLS